VHDRGVGGGVLLGVVDGVQVERAGPGVAGEGERAEVAAVSFEGGDVLQDLGVVDSVVGVDAEAEAGGEFDRAVDAVQRGREAMSSSGVPSPASSPRSSRSVPPSTSTTASAPKWFSTVR
jgi:hypothetical protein